MMMTASWQVGGWWEGARWQLMIGRMLAPVECNDAVCVGPSLPGALFFIRRRSAPCLPPCAEPSPVVVRGAAAAAAACGRQQQQRQRQGGAGEIDLTEGASGGGSDSDGGSPASSEGLGAGGSDGDGSKRYGAPAAGVVRGDGDDDEGLGIYKINTRTFPIKSQSESRGRAGARARVLSNETRPKIGVCVEPRSGN